MHIVERVVLPLRVLLVILFGVLVFLQLFSLPAQFAYLAEQDPDLADLRWPLLALSIVELACVQVVIVCTWRLLTMVRVDRIFTDEAFVWVDLILGAMGTAWALFAGVSAYGASTSEDPALPLLLVVLVLVGGVVLLLMVVMRALLRQATALRTDMEAVI
jgi:hypothetical protein